MSKAAYDKYYFDNYLKQGKVLKHARGDKGALYGYWMRYLQNNVSRKSNILEIGCGLGFMGKRIQQLYSYVGLDISADAVTYASEVNRIKNVIQGEAEKLPFENGKFDVVMAFDIAEHLETPMSLFKEAYRVLKSSGILIISTPNIYSFGVRRKSHSISLVPSMYKDKSHVSLLASEVWMTMIQDAGFIIIRSGTDTLWDIPYYESIPSIIQKMILIPLNTAVTMFFGFLKWKLGENFIIIARK
jgi:SAM-dependent methyltransferase